MPLRATAAVLRMPERIKSVAINISTLWERRNERHGFMVGQRCYRLNCSVHEAGKRVSRVRMKGYGWVGPGLVDIEAATPMLRSRLVTKDGWRARRAITFVVSVDVEARR